MVSMRMMMRMMPWWLSLSSAVLLRDETEDHLLLLFLFLLLLLLPATRSLDDGRPHPYLKRLSPLRVNYSSLETKRIIEEHDDATKKTRPTTFRPPSSSSRLEKSHTTFLRKGFSWNTTRDGSITRCGTNTHQSERRRLFPIPILVVSPRGLRYQCLGFRGKKVDRNPIP